MFRSITYDIPQLPTPIRISTFLRRKGYSRQNLIEFKKFDDSVLVDGCSRHFNELLLGGEEITVRIPLDFDPADKVLPVCLPAQIVYEDADIIVVNKPAGMPTHPSHGNRDNTLANAMAWHFREKGEPYLFRCSNRLDRDTSGLTVLARHMLSGNIQSVMGTNRQISRTYLAIVSGCPSPSEGTIDAPLSRAEGSILMRQVDFEHGERAVTHYKTISTVLRGPGAGEKKEYSLVSLRLETGRTHQIRVHMKYLGYPLIGDYLYNPDMQLMHRQALHSEQLRFRHPMTGEMLSFRAPLPDDMRWILSSVSF